MTRRLLEKKPGTIFFNESPDEHEVNDYWDINYSSDEDIFLKGKSEILWSRTRDLFDSPNSYESFSDFTGRTFSSCSWHNDEFDMKSSSKVNASLEAIDSALYEKEKSPFLSDSLFLECCDWTEKFPYIRIKGKHVTSTDSEHFVSYSTNAACFKTCDIKNLSSSLHLEGKKLPIHSASKSRGIFIDNVNEDKVTTCIEEEETDTNERHEEYFALHQSDKLIDSMEVPLNDSAKTLSAMKLLQDKVLDKLVSEMWPSVVAFLGKLPDRSSSSMNNNFQLPPIAVSTEQKRVLCLKRPNTEGSSVINSEFPKLDSILNVSPKVLQKRDLGSVSRAVRPNSEMSVNPRMSSISVKPMYHHSNGVRINSEIPYIKDLKSARESERLCLVLPVLEEDFQDSSSVLRGFHIEPERKDSASKTIQPPGNDYERLSSSRENNYHLPPIKDKNSVPTNVKLTKNNLFTFYGTPVMRDKSRHPGSAKYKKTNSRPNTSVSKKTFKSQQITQQLPVNNGMYINAKGGSKISSSLYTERNRAITVVERENIEESPEKSVTLFPIVTPLTPQEDKHNSIKKGLVHTFVGGRKR